MIRTFPRKELWSMRRRAQNAAAQYNLRDHEYRIFTALADAIDNLDAYLARIESGAVDTIPGSMENMMSTMKTINVKDLIESSAETARLMVEGDKQEKERNDERSST